MRIRGFRLEILGDYVALALCLIIFLFSLPGFNSASILATVIFFPIIPGYAFTRAFFPKMSILEKIIIIIATSIGMSTFTQSFLKVFISRMNIPVIPILCSISIILMLYVILRERYRG